MCEINFDLKDELKEMELKFKQLNKRKEYLSAKNSELDKKIEDIMHCAEFYELDACKGYKLYKILHETRLERRKVKDEVDMLIEVLSKLSITNIKQSLNAIDNMSRERKYTPRVVDELFDLLK